MKTKIRQLLFIAVLLGVLFGAITAFVPPKMAAAASNFVYTDTSYKEVSGPNLDDNNKVGIYKRVDFSGGGYAYTNTSGGHTDSISVAKLGASSGTLHYGLDIPQKSQVIQISLPQGGSGGTTGNYVGKWVDHSQITVNGETFIDAKIDKPLQYQSTNTDDCKSQDSIDGFPGTGADTKNATATVDLHLHSIPGNGNNSCVETKYRLTFDPSTKSNFSYYFAWQDAGTISTSDETGIIFVSSDGSTFLDNGSGRSGDSTCQSQITADVGGLSGSLILRTSGDRHLSDGWPSEIANADLTDKGQGCSESKPITVALADPLGSDGLYAHQRDAGSSDVGSGGGSSTASAPTLSCHAGWNPLNWLLCAAVNGMVNIASGIENVVDSLLSIGTPGNQGTDPNQIFCDSNTKDKAACTGFHNAWNSVRLIALGLMVIAGLVVIISQALGMEVLDAYTIRKVLPRLLAAAIFLTLSWQIMQFFVELTNALGYGVRWLIYAPFQGPAFQSAAITPGGGGSVVTVILGFVAFKALGIFGLLSFAGTAALALFIAFLVLVIRQLVLVVVIIFAPIAIVAYILPNTKKVYDIWWDSFAKALLMFPLITAFIAAGRVFAVVTTTQNPPPVLSQYIAFAAYFAPYFLLPLTFRFAGGALRNIGGFMNDRSRGGFDRLRNFRSNQQKKRMANAGERIRTGNAFRGNNFLSKGASTALQSAALAPTALSGAGINPRRMGAKVRANMISARGARNFDAASEFLEKNDAARAIKNDDDKLWAAMNGNNEQQVRDELLKRAPDRFSDPQNLNNAVAEVMRFKREAGGEVGRIAATRAQATTGTGFNYRHDGIDDDMTDAIIRASGDDRGLSGRMLGEMRQAALQSGRVGLAGGGFAKNAQVMDLRRAAKANGGMIEVKDENGNTVRDASGNAVMRTYSAEDARKDIMRDVLNSNAGAAVAGKLEDVVQLAPVMKEMADAALSSGDTARAARELAKLAGKYDAASQVAPQNAEALATGVLAKNIEIRTLSPELRVALAPAIDAPLPNGAQGPRNTITYQQAIEALRGNPDFQTMRREYQTASSAAAAQAAMQQPGTPPGALPPIPGVPRPQ